MHPLNFVLLIRKIVDSAEKTQLYKTRTTINSEGLLCASISSLGALGRDLDLRVRPAAPAASGNLGVCPLWD